MISTTKKNESALIKSLYNDIQIIGNVKAKDLFYISDYREIYKLLGFIEYDDSGVHIFVNRILERLQM